MPEHQTPRAAVGSWRLCTAHTQPPFRHGCSGQAEHDEGVDGRAKARKELERKLRRPFSHKTRTKRMRGGRARRRVFPRLRGKGTMRSMVKGAFVAGIGKWDLLWRLSASYEVNT